MHCRLAPESDVDFVGIHNDTVIVTLADLIDSAGSADIRQLAKALGPLIEHEAPEQVVAHDIGLTVTILALLFRIKRGFQLPRSVILFNGAFSGFDVLVARHPIWIQLKSTNKIAQELASKGVVMDDRLKQHSSKIRSMYRQIIAVSLLDKVSSIIIAKPVKTLHWPIKTLIIEGVNDPYIPRSAIDQLATTLAVTERVIGYEGHFPYLGDKVKIRKLVDEFS
ncbi:MAG: hypothetical protein FJ146_16545 [Deltaproteobacteria bacterium]|nr:hypothetical protein [Deltaproteobacteria bacterium]